MNELYGNDSPMPSYLIFPRALLKLELTASELSIYMLLLDRARLSARNGNWTDSRGQVYLYYTVRSLAEDIGRSDTAVKKALRGLEEKDLILRKRQGLGKPSRIYVKLPEGGREASPSEGKEASPAEEAPPSPGERKEASPRKGRRVPPNKNHREKKKEQSTGSKDMADAYNRMIFLLEKMDAQPKGAVSPLIPRSPGPSPGQPPSYP